MASQQNLWVGETYEVPYISLSTNSCQAGALNLTSPLSNCLLRLNVWVIL